MQTLYNIGADGTSLNFPPLSCAWGSDSPAPGLLAQGGDLSVGRLKLAYSKGIFPWFSHGEPILWWSLDPRMVLYPHHFKFSRSLRKSLKNFLTKDGGEIKINTSFQKVMQSCADSKRKGQHGTWITPSIIHAYTQLHQEGFAHSFEAWLNGELIGGLYGVGTGHMFYGESMFSHYPNASKLALCGLIAFSLNHHIELIDCQQQTQHLTSLGGHVIPRAQFIKEMEHANTHPALSWHAQSISSQCWSALEQLVKINKYE